MIHISSEKQEVTYMKYNRGDEQVTRSRVVNKSNEKRPHSKSNERKPKNANKHEGSRGKQQVVQYDNNKPGTSYIVNNNDNVKVATFSEVMSRSCNKAQNKSSPAINQNTCKCQSNQKNCSAPLVQQLRGAVKGITVLMESLLAVTETISGLKINWTP